jgi:hypothetical protein
MALGRKRTDFDLGTNTHNVTADQVSHMTHGLGPHVQGSAHPDIARNGRGKRLDVVPYHSGMQRVRNGVPHPVRPIDDEKFQPKFKSELPPVPISPGMRSRTAGAGEVEPLDPGYHANKANKERGLRNFNHHQLGQNVIAHSVKSGSTSIKS